MIGTILRAAGILLFGLLIQFFIRLYRIRSRLRGQPGPPYSFLLGHIPILAKLVTSLPPDIHPHTYHYFLKKKYNLPDVYYLDTWPLGYPICAILDPEAAQHAAAVRNLPKHPSIDSVIWPITGENSLVSINGLAHKKWRSLFNPGFNSSHLMTLVPGIVEDCEVFARRLAKHAEDQDIFQLEEAATQVTIDIIGRVVLDVPMDAQSTENEFVRAFRTSLDWLPNPTKFNPFQDLNPLRQIIYRVNERRMNKYLMRIMNERFANRSTDKTASSKRSKPIIDLALDNYITEHSTGAASQPVRQLDQSFQQEALNHIRVFMFGGHDTTSSTICWVAYNLLRHPECLQKFRAECDQVFGSDPSTTASTIKENPHIINNLGYTLAIIKETLRLYPAASSVRLGQADYFVNYDGDNYFTEDFLVWPVAHAIHRNPKFWPQADEFIPERWLAPEGDPLSSQSTHKGAWRAFEYGPRNCIGQELAIIETKIIMALAFRNMAIEMAYDEWDQRLGRKTQDRLTPEGNRAYQVLIATAKPCDGMPVRMKRR